MVSGSGPTGPQLASHCGGKGLEIMEMAIIVSDCGEVNVGWLFCAPQNKN